MVDIEVLSSEYEPVATYRMYQSTYEQNYFEPFTHQKRKVLTQKFQNLLAGSTVTENCEKLLM